MKIAFYDTREFDRLWFEKMSEEFGYEISFYDSKLNVDTAILAQGHEAVCLFVNDIFDKDVLDAIYNVGVKVILLRCAGYDHIDIEAAQGKFPILRVPSYSPNAIAEYAAALLLSVNRRVHKAYSRTRDFNFSITGLMGVNLKDKTAGVIGTGKIGQVMINILKGFGMRVVAYDPYPDSSLEVEYMTADELFKTSDVITLHCPLNNDTKYIINKNSISKMKDGVILINTSRGGLVDTQALIDGLKHNKFLGVALDVYEEEEDYFFEDKSDEIIKDEELIKLMAYPNVIVTSHQAFFTMEAMEAIARVTMENLKAFENGEELENEVKFVKKGATI